MFLLLFPSHDREGRGSAQGYNYDDEYDLGNVARYQSTFYNRATAGPDQTGVRTYEDFYGNTIKVDPTHRSELNRGAGQTGASTERVSSMAYETNQNRVDSGSAYATGEGLTINPYNVAADGQVDKRSTFYDEGGFHSTEQGNIRKAKEQEIINSGSAFFSDDYIDAYKRLYQYSSGPVLNQSQRGYLQSENRKGGFTASNYNELTAEQQQELMSRGGNSFAISTGGRVY